MRSFLIGLSIFSLLTSIHAQEPYRFVDIINLEATPVISQGNTGTCWSFSSTSFLESEIIRTSGKAIDLSEMYTVRMTYPLKAANYIHRQGKAQFSEGGLAHDVINVASSYGLVPEVVYDGTKGTSDRHNHSEMIAILSSMVKTYVENPAKALSPKWKTTLSEVLDSYLGAPPTQFSYQGTTYTPMSFLEMTGLDLSAYKTFTSFTQAPFYEAFILNIPDNWSNGSMYNLPLDDMMLLIDEALKNGYTVELDCDVSESTFSSKNGVAVVPKDDSNPVKSLLGIYPEKQIDQDYRQQEFENYHTTDDHLMHITGKLKDQNGTTYYRVKNSWGTDPNRNANGGYVYFSESYMRLKAISIMIHEDAIPATIAKKLKF